MPVILDMNELFTQLAQRRASDLHITAGSPPVLRIDGEMVPTDFEKLTPDITQRLVYSLLTDSQREKFETTNELDVAFSVKGVGRIRMNVFRQRGSIGAALRAIPSKILQFEELGLPSITYDLVKMHRGLILVTGPTGSGKSTTLASMINYINEHRAGHIVTVEDPIEYVHPHKRCIINQREIGQDSQTFTAALKYVLRQDPDVILIGEMRDIETIAAAVTIAETGHLVFATLHTNDAVTSINRIIDVFPPHQQAQVRTQLSFVIQAVFSQMLVPKASGSGRALVCEILTATPAIRHLIRDQKIEQIYSLIQTGSKFGMQTINQSLADLVNKKIVNLQTALEISSDAEELRRMLHKATVIV